MTKEKKDIVVVYNGTLANAALIQTYLTNDGIPCFLKDETVNRSDFFVNDNFSGVKVVVSSENEIAAKELILKFKGSHIIKT